MASVLIYVPAFQTASRWLFTPSILYLANGLLLLIALCLAIGRATPSASEEWQLVLVIDVLGRLDGEAYQRILQYGYTFSRDGCSTAVFFPGYPCVAWALHDCGLSVRGALLATSWLALLGAFILAQYYLRERFRNDPVTANLALAAFAFNPMAYYMWFMYSEATFLFLLVLLLALIERGAPPAVAAVVCGALTGVRSAGVAAIPVVLVYAWRHRPVARSRAVNVILTLVLCGWGLALFAWKMHQDFGDALAFVHAQEAFEPANRTLSEKVWSLATLGPLRRLIASTGYGIPRQPGLLGLFSNQFGDAFSWVLFGVLIGLGWWKRWLNWQELLLSVLLFAFSTWFQADRSDLASQGRYMSVIFPVYLVAGRLLAAVQWEMRLALATIVVGLYINYAVNFAVGNAW